MHIVTKLLSSLLLVCYVEPKCRIVIGAADSPEANIAIADGADANNVLCNIVGQIGTFVKAAVKKLIHNPIIRLKEFQKDSTMGMPVLILSAASSTWTRSILMTSKKISPANLHFSRTKTI
jgi:hypothetical protein